MSKNNLTRRIAATACLLLLTASAVLAQSTASVQLTMGNPSGATTDVNFPSNYLMSKPQYAHSYHRDHGVPNWVSWHRGPLDLGSAARCDCFKSDPNLPSAWYHVTTGSYTSSGYDRGHMCPSADRTASSTD